MFVFIGNLPSVANESEIAHLLEKFGNNTETLKNLTFQKHRDSYFCIANISNDRKARKFIRKYNLKSPFGQELMVREFIHRSYGNERRDINWRQKQWRGAENRHIERRAHKPESFI
jgi:RNA recognition motif-containing protein